MCYCFIRRIYLSKVEPEWWIVRIANELWKAVEIVKRNRSLGESNSGSGRLRPPTHGPPTPVIPQTQKMKKLSMHTNLCAERRDFIQSFNRIMHMYYEDEYGNVKCINECRFVNEVCCPGTDTHICANMQKITSVLCVYWHTAHWVNEPWFLGQHGGDMCPNRKKSSSCWLCV